MKYNSNKYLKLLCVFAFITMSINSIAQNKIIHGKVLNEYNEPMNDVTINSINLNKEVKSDCKGRFKIEVTINDSLILAKERYLSKKVKVKKNNCEYLVAFDYEAAIKELDENTGDLEFPFGCNPLYVVNGEVGFNYNREKKADTEGLKKKDLNIIVLKGKEATDKFGKYANNGLFWITIKCKKK